MTAGTTRITKREEIESCGRYLTASISTVIGMTSAPPMMLEMLARGRQKDLRRLGAARVTTPGSASSRRRPHRRSLRRLVPTALRL